MALEEAGSSVQGATVYVTLEPCNFHGRTPPCTDALIDAGVKKIVIGCLDPHPKVSGNGRNKLEEAGIEVEELPLSRKAENLNCGFMHHMKTGLPFVRVKLAQSLDGRTAMANGDSVWITGEKARKDVQVWRGRSQAVLTGIETVLHDDCRLTVRPGEFPKKYYKLPHRFENEQPLRVILDTHLRTPLDAKIIAQSARTIVMTSSKDEDKIRALENVGAEVINMSKP